MPYAYCLMPVFVTVAMRVIATPLYVTEVTSSTVESMLTDTMRTLSRPEQICDFVSVVLPPTLCAVA